MGSDVEEAKRSVAKGGGDGAEMEARFHQLIKGLELEGTVEKEVVDLYRQCRTLLVANVSSIGSGSPEETERHWSAFVLYCVMKLRNGNGGGENEKGGVSLSRILKATKMNAVDFFREMPQFLLKSGHVLRRLYGSEWERRLEVKEAQANFVHLRLLSSYYKRAYEEFFLPDSMKGGEINGGTTCAGFVSEYHRFGWLLFLALRIHAFNRLKDLVSCTNGLVSILAILIIHIPATLRRIPFSDCTRLVKKTDKGIDLIASLCDIYHTSENDLKIAMERTNSLIEDILKKTPSPASKCKAESLADFNTDGLTYFEDLMEQDSLQSSLLILESNYENAVHTKGEIDERIFVNDEDSLLGSGSLSGGAINFCGSKRKFDAIASPCKSITSPLSPPRSPTSPVNGKMLGSTKIAATPVGTAMTTAKWLRTIIAPLSSKPSSTLELFISSCPKNTADDLNHRANVILEAIFPCNSCVDRSTPGSLQNATMVDHIWAGERKMEALKLYYRVLESICRAESHMIGSSNLTSLLSNERFHRCMLSCSAELVLATHKTVSMMFPAVLERTGITAFDLSKVIESFVRHEETLPRELKRHLNSLEERLLESLSWEKGSSMYASLVVARPALSEEIDRLQLLPEPMPSLDSIALRHNIAYGGSPPRKNREILPDLNGEFCSPTRVMPNLRSALLERNSFKSPVKDPSIPFNSPKSKLPALQSAFATPTRLNPGRGGETCAETGIHVFFSKIVKLAAIRIKSLCEKLKLQQQILEHVYVLVQQIINEKTFLFFNRHIDQIILCSLYGVAKISQLPLTFKEIINCYRKQPQCKPQVFRSVFVDWPSNSHNGKRGQEYVDIITFYNGVFIPSVKPLLVELGHSGSVPKTNRTSDVNVFDGNCPGSPRLSQFPSLPDMSPKKVSATHNVYVSPLRASKMDALLSPSSKSYYACVGESTHAYQSPSKDLTAINNRINSGRKLRLNFDVVSDSLVAGSLSSQNGTSVSSSANMVVASSVKCEQHDM